MTAILGNLQGSLDQAYHWAQGVGTTVKQEVNLHVQKTKICLIQTQQATTQACQNAALKTKEFVSRNKETLFFLGCCIVTAYFAPHLFFPVAVVTIIFRVQLAHYLSKAADYYMKDNRNPYKLNPFYGPNYVNSLDLTLASIGAVDAIALGTIFITGSWVVALLPALAGVAAGNYAAEWGMDVAHSWNAASLPLVI